MLKQSCLVLGILGVAPLALGQASALVSSPGAKKISQAAYWRLNTEKDVAFGDGEFPVVIGIQSWEVMWRPNDYSLVTELGFMYGNIERKDLELATYIRFREQFPNLAESYYPEAEFYFKNRVYKPVVGLLEPTLNMTPKPHPNNFRILAHAYDRLGLFKKSLETWDTYLKLAPDDAAAKMNREKVKAKISDGKS